MEDNNQPTILNEIISENLSKDKPNEILLNAIENENISSQNIIEKEKDEILDIKEEKDKIEENNIKSEIKKFEENKDNPLIKKLLNIQKLVQKELSTRKICK